MATTSKAEGVAYATTSALPTAQTGLLSRLWAARGFFGGILAVGLAVIGQLALLQSNDYQVAWRYYGAASIILILSLLHPVFNWRRGSTRQGAGPASTGAPEAGVVGSTPAPAPSPTPVPSPQVPIVTSLAAALPVRKAGARAAADLAQASSAVVSQPAISTTLPTRPAATAWLPETAPAQPRAARKGAAQFATAAMLVPTGEKAGLWSRWMALRDRLGWRVTAPGLVIAAVLGGAATFILLSDLTSPLGGWLWAAAVFVLFMTFLGAPGWPRGASPLAGPQDESDFFGRGVPSIPVRWEIVLVVVVMAVATALRLYNLETFPGIFGDEGERGVNARDIFLGRPDLIFGSGWWAVPNLYFYIMAAIFHVLGDHNMVADRMLSVISGLLAVFFIYKAGRLLWGPRVGLIAGFMLAVSPLALEFSRLAGESTPTGTLWAIGFYYLALALRRRRWGDWVLSGIFWGLSLYFYAAGKLIIPLIAAVGAYCLIRWRMDFFKKYALGFVLLGAVFLMTAMPYGLYSKANNWENFTSRARETSIFTPENQQRTFERYGLTYDPNLAKPSMTDALKTNPVAWAQLLYQQMRETTDVLFRRGDEVYFYRTSEWNGAMFPPFWAAIVVLSLVYATWKLWDPRFGLVSIVFWSGMLGSALTIDTPNLQRVTGAWPVLMLLPAALVDRIFAAAWPLNLSLARKWAAVPIAASLIWFGGDSYQNFFDHYYSLCPYCRDTVQARFVQGLDDQYKGYQLGVGDYDVYFTYGSTRFLAKGVEGEDLNVPADFFPITDNNGKGAAFIFYQNNIQYLSVFKQLYPGGVQNEEKGQDGVPQFTSYKLTKEQLAAFQMVHASYAPQQGSPVNRDEPNLGSTTGSGAPWQPPASLSFPATATWQGGLVAPTYGSYAFQLTGSGAKLDIDGKTMIDGSKQGGSDTAPLGVQLVLAKGIHDVRLTGTLADANSRVDLLWGGKDAPLNPIDARYLFNGTTGGLSAERSNTVVPDALHAADPFAGQAIIERRVDPFFGFREGVVDFGQSAFVARWQGTLTVPAAGPYAFGLSSSGSVVLRIDNQPVIDGQAGGGIGQGNGTINLSTGPHTVDLRYAWNGGPARLEWYWTPPDGERAIVPPTVLTPLQRSWPIDQVPNVPPGAVQHQDEAPVKVSPDAVIGDGAGLSKSARGVGVDAQGNIYVGDQGNHRIVVFSPDGKVLRTWGKAAPDDNQKPPPGEFTLINDIAVQPNGTVYVVENTGVVQVFDNQGKFLRMMGPEDLGMYAPNGIDVGPDGSVYIADTGRNRVLKLSPTSNGLPTTDFVGDTANAGSIVHLNQPVDALVYGKDGKEQVFGVDIKNRIEQLGADGNMVKEWLLPVGILEGGSKLSISPDGSRIYMSDTDRARVAVLNLSDGSVIFFGGKGSDPGMFGSPSGIATGPDGRVYVLDRANGNVQVFKPPTK